MQVECFYIKIAVFFPFRSFESFLKKKKSKPNMRKFNRYSTPNEKEGKKIFRNFADSQSIIFIIFR